MSAYDAHPGRRLVGTVMAGDHAGAKVTQELPDGVDVETWAVTVGLRTLGDLVWTVEEGEQE